MKTTNLPQVLKVKEMWENYDTNVVKDQLHDQVSFSCPSSLTLIDGKRNVIIFLNMLLRASRNLVSLFGIRTEYQVVKESGNDYYLRIHRNDGDTETICLLGVEIREDKIFCIEMKYLS